MEAHASHSKEYYEISSIMSGQPLLFQVHAPDLKIQNQKQNNHKDCVWPLIPK